MKRMCPSGAVCTSDRCERAEQCLGGDYDAIAAGTEAVSRRSLVTSVLTHKSSFDRMQALEDGDA